MAIRMNAEVASRVQDRFDNLSNEFDQTDSRWAGQMSILEWACGEFAEDVTDGCDTARLGWRSLLDVCSTTSGLIAGNTNALHVDLTTVDQDYSWKFDLTGSSTALPRGARGAI